MPGRRYDSPDYGSASNRETQEKMDMLARIACRALTALETINKVAGSDVKNTVDIGATINSVLKDSEVAVWWPKHKIADAAEQAKKRKAVEDAAALTKVKKAALSKLTKEEKKILGIK